MYTAIRNYDEQAFDNMCEERGKKQIKKLYREEIVAASSKWRHG